MEDLRKRETNKAIGERVKEAIEYLKKENILRNDAHLATISEVDPGHLSKMKSGKLALSSKLEDTLTNKFNISLNWLLKGEGSMLRGEGSGEASAEEVESLAPVLVATDEESYQRALASGVEMIPEREAFFRGGDQGEVNDTAPIIAHWHIPHLRYKDAEVVTIRGDSMTPILPSGVKVVVRPYSFCPNEPTCIAFGEIYAIVVEDELTGQRDCFIKYLRKHQDPELARKYWIARSANPNYDDFDIPIRSVSWLGRVEVSISIY